MDFTTWIESTGLSQYVRESPSIVFGFPGILTAHAIGMGFLVGVCTAINLRLLGFAPRVPLSAMGRFYPVLWLGFVINAFSGILLLIGYPTKALTNPVFYAKLICIAIGVSIAVWMGRTVFRNRSGGYVPVPGARFLAAISLVFWAAAIFTGRFLAYTCSYLMADMRC